MSEVIYGKKVIQTAVTNRFPIANVRLTAENQALIAFLKTHEINYQIVSKDILNRITPHHQGVIAEISGFPNYTLDQLISEKPKGKSLPLIVALDGLEDPHNLGAIIRTVEATSGDGVIFAKNRSVKLNATVAKVSTGAIFNVKCSEVVNLTQTLKYLKTKGYWVVGTDASAKINYSSLKYDFPMILVIGSEGKGISRLVLEQCDYLVSIPMMGVINSLNASVSAGILIYEIRKQQWE
ncbi:MAG TPA: 23S rRNA (guanosine(2251)-2'-O)-methyltransferase RlmB [Bacilli bacterium]|nr:MAG: putative TrmH family tRNA/rRNA methyltransferase [Tenericutes bacterium ADurb.BinA124]HNZ50956.1 23S rRNA (guanosine(2251)-2'-O)-methyltransferase RlmB [Bacilli bacterium]HOH17858.1 23S rRNA (guanosine(2251)-2'-O)-methyltransferase RlmB [Bacilli bacterium]HPN60773.1 23S rRNA (guanosine(2251)-2'-O)-methyltransferase RlmB [Bacilli bacterium]HPX84102.1 23S rRNA (guanosine(2251)-2'-O)-methyltransferase RlmB [Bacilli bacterium]